MAWDLVGVRINEEKTKLMKLVSAQKGGVGMRMLIESSHREGDTSICDVETSMENFLSLCHRGQS